MCIAYSSMGCGEGGENTNGRLLIIYMLYHFRKGTPLLAHENVPGFETEKMKDTAEQYGYRCVSIWCKPMDVNFHVGRPRKQHTCNKQIGILLAADGWGQRLGKPYLILMLTVFLYLFFNMSNWFVNCFYQFSALFSTFNHFSLNFNLFFKFSSCRIDVSMVFLSVFCHFPWWLHAFHLFFMVSHSKNLAFIMSHCCFNSFCFFIIIFHWLFIRLNPVQFILVDFHFQHGPHQGAFPTSRPFREWEE